LELRKISHIFVVLFLSSKLITKTQQMATKKQKEKAKKEKFKQAEKQKAAQQAIPRTHLVPVPTWQSTDNLDIRGDLLEALEQNLMAAMDAVQKCGQVAQYVMQMNVASKKITLNYVWNNGEAATEAEVETFKEQLKKLQEERTKQALDLQNQIKQDQNAAKTGLVGVDGQPIGTTQDLEEDNDETSDEQTENDSENESAG